MKSHKELVEIGYRWLKRSKSRNRMPCYSSCTIALKEVSIVFEEKPDIIGFKYWLSILIECKATRADFLSDKTKSFRKYPEEGIGQYRFYLINEGVAKPEELPDKWGLLCVSGNSIRILKDPQKFNEYNLSYERGLLVKIIKRISCFDMMELINDARYKEIPYEYDIDDVGESTIEKIKPEL